MSILVEGHGLTVAHGSTSITQNPISVEIPGFTSATIDRTTQGNTAVKTSEVATLREYEDFTHVFPYDPDDYSAWSSAHGTESAHVITLPDSLGTFTIYCKVLSVGNISNETDGRPTYDVTFHPTNLNSGSETAPAFGS